MIATMGASARPFYTSIEAFAATIEANNEPMNPLLHPSGSTLFGTTCP